MSNLRSGGRLSTEAVQTASGSHRWVWMWEWLVREGVVVERETEEEEEEVLE